MNSLQVATPSLAELCESLLPLPKHSIVLGIRQDGLPILYDVSKERTPNVVVWDRILGQGIRLIKTAIEFILRYKTGHHTEFVIISNRTKEWQKLTDHELGVWNNNECVAVVPFWDIVCDQVLFGLAGWVRKQSRAKTPVILFIDGLENIDKMGNDTQGWFRFISLAGREKNIYVIACAESKHRESLVHWQDCFQAEVYGSESAIQWLELDADHKTVLFYTPDTRL